MIALIFLSLVLSANAFLFPRGGTTGGSSSITGNQTFLNATCDKVATAAITLANHTGYWYGLFVPDAGYGISCFKVSFNAYLPPSTLGNAFLSVQSNSNVFQSVKFNATVEKNGQYYFYNTTGSPKYYAQFSVREIFNRNDLTGLMIATICYTTGDSTISYFNMALTRASTNVAQNVTDYANSSLTQLGGSYVLVPQPNCPF